MIRKTNQLTVRKTRLAAKILLLLVGAISFSAHAQDIQEPEGPDATAIQIFDKEYFLEYAPRTALDILLRIPGFQIVGADSKRGLGQGSANILVNGARLPGKNDDPEEQLRRISAENILRVELIDGTRSNVAGLTGRVANIITGKSSLSGNWSWETVFRDDVRPNLGGANISISGSEGNFDYTLALKNTSNISANSGPELRSSNNVIEIVQERFDGSAFGPTASANLGWQLSEKVKANLELEYSVFDIEEQEVSGTQFFSSNQRPSTVFFLGLKRRQGQITGDLALPLGPGRAKITGLYNFLKDNENSVFERFGQSTVGEVERFELDLFKSEKLVRGEYNLSLSSGHSWQLAAEYANNSLRSQTGLFQRAGAGTFVQIELPDSDTQVAEDRFEATITHRRTLSDSWELQTSLGVEYSKLAQLGNSSNSKRTFFRPKGFAALTYSPDKTLSISSKIERKVGQLNFFDFTSSVSLQDDLDRTGNPDLVPQQTWRAEIAANKVLKSGHSFNFTVFGENITDLVDRIAIGETGDGIGNIDRASRFGVQFLTTLKGEAWGWNGVELQFEYDRTWSNVRDPFGGFNRGLSNEFKQRFLAKFSHDIPNTSWAYGVQIDQTLFEPIYRIRTIDRNNTDPLVMLYLEHKDIHGLKLRASIVNAIDQTTKLDREIFSTRRDAGDVTRTEKRRRSSRPFIRFELSGRF